jgi:hypothetical protein
MHSDLSEKFSVKSKGGALYYISLIDEKTRYAWVRFLKKKSDASEALESMVHEAQRQTGRKLKTMRTDRGGEYVAVDSFFDKEGIIHEQTPAYSHESNGMAERFNRTVITMARGMIHRSKLPLSFWGEAINTAVYIKNRLPHAGVQGKTPYESLYGEKPSIKHLQPFRRKCYVYIYKEQRPAGSKLLPRAQEDHFVGYKDTITKIYRVYLTSDKRVIETNQVRFLLFIQSIDNHQ